MRVLYSYSGMASLRHDLFLCFGLWYAYSYSHVVLWTEFRATFLGDAFWTIFPTQKLLRRPPLVQCSTMFTWIRLSYPHFRNHLLAKIDEMRDAMLDFDINLTSNIEQGVRVQKFNPFRGKYIRLCNLLTLLEFCIPVIQDYGVALKGNDWVVFSRCFMAMVLFFVCCNGKGASDYQRSLYCL